MGAAAVDHLVDHGLLVAAAAELQALLDHVARKLVLGEDEKCRPDPFQHKRPVFRPSVLDHVLHARAPITHQWRT